jgi:hypothetical protein
MSTMGISGGRQVISRLRSRRWRARWGAALSGVALVAACGDGGGHSGDGEATPTSGGAGAGSGGAPAAGVGAELEVEGGARNHESLGGAGSGAGARAGEGGGSETFGGVAGESSEGRAGGSGGIGSDAGGEGGAPSGAIEVTDFADYQVVQRTLGGNSQRVRIHGTFTGPDIASVQGQVVSFASGATVIVPWTELAVMSAGVYSGLLEVREGGWYRLVVRARDQRGREIARATGANRWGVGMNVLCIGQSNMVGYGGSTYTKAGDLSSLFNNDGAWTHLTDPYDRGGKASDVDFDAGPGASLVPSLANTLSAYFPGLPIGFIPAAKGSSPLVCSGSEPCWGLRDAVKPANPATLYGNSVAKAQAAGGVELIVMHQGETDATNSTSTAKYASALSLLAQNFRTDLGNVPLFMCQLGRSTTDIAAKGRTDTTMQAIRIAQHDSDSPPNIYLAATAIDLDVDATDHYKKATLDELGRRIGGAIAYHYGVASAPAAYRGPEIESVSYADATRSVIDVRLTHRGGNDFTPAAGISGFVVLDGAAPVQLASVVRKDQATIRITLKTPIQGVGAVRYLHGKLPFQTLPGTVHDDSSLALPLEPTTLDLVLP